MMIRGSLFAPHPPNFSRTMSNPSVDTSYSLPKHTPKTSHSPPSLLLYPSVPSTITLVQATAIVELLFLLPPLHLFIPPSTPSRLATIIFLTVRSCQFIFHYLKPSRAVIYNNQNLETTLVAINGWVNKQKGLSIP